MFNKWAHREDRFIGLISRRSTSRVLRNTGVRGTAEAIFRSLLKTWPIKAWWLRTLLRLSSMSVPVLVTWVRHGPLLTMHACKNMESELERVSLFCLQRSSQLINLGVCLPFRRWYGKLAFTSFIFSLIACFWFPHHCLVVGCGQFDLCRLFMLLHFTSPRCPAFSCLPTKMECRRLEGPHRLP